jgi:hypothetical protein
MLSLREKHEYESVIAHLKYRLNREIKNKSKIKCKYDNLKARRKIGTPNRSDKARLLIKQKWSGELSITLKEIANKVFLSYATVRELSFEYKGVNK